MAEQVCGSVKNELIISLLLLGGMAISLIASLACLLKMVPVATLLGAQHYKASTGSPLTNC